MTCPSRIARLPIRGRRSRRQQTRTEKGACHAVKTLVVRKRASCPKLTTSPRTPGISRHQHQKSTHSLWTYPRCVAGRRRGSRKRAHEDGNVCKTTWHTSRRKHRSPASGQERAKMIAQLDQTGQEGFPPRTSQTGAGNARRPAAPGCLKTRPQVLNARIARCVGSSRRNATRCRDLPNHPHGSGCGREQGAQDIVQDCRGYFSANRRILQNFFRKSLHNYHYGTYMSRKKRALPVPPKPSKKSKAHRPDQSPPTAAATAFFSYHREKIPTWRRAQHGDRHVNISRFHEFPALFFCRQGTTTNYFVSCMPIAVLSIQSNLFPIVRFPA